MPVVITNNRSIINIETATSGPVILLNVATPIISVVPIPPGIREMNANTAEREIITATVHMSREYPNDRPINNIRIHLLAHIDIINSIARNTLWGLIIIYLIVSGNEKI